MAKTRTSARRPCRKLRGSSTKIGDDRDIIQPDAPVSPNCGKRLELCPLLLLEVAREKGFKGLVTSLGAVALAMTREYLPAALTLDILLPDMDGWRVPRAPETRISTRGIFPSTLSRPRKLRERALASGARGMLVKPVPTRDASRNSWPPSRTNADRPVKDLLLIESDAERRQQLLELNRQWRGYPDHRRRVR